MKNLNVNQILISVEKDVKQRIEDWISSGGSLKDDYVKRQNNYLHEIMNKFN